ncbi:hypothetical protein OSCT_0288 [Oscillochloris trichoides DG-6]|uniref:Uncharacterized protein n=1 Tax=Oscillochloris trichoides DG-6 TaxID=765420 RepID=E1IAD7_9CHLR|nr:hypothetical protein OSCT_0288 [Oscillochloris trichoides DG-6]
MVPKASNPPGGLKPDSPECRSYRRDVPKASNPPGGLKRRGSQRPNDPPSRSSESLKSARRIETDWGFLPVEESRCSESLKSARRIETMVSLPLRLAGAGFRKPQIRPAD